MDTHWDTQLLSQRFRNFSIKECKDSSQLYEHLTLKISEDHELLELSAYSGDGQPVPNLFLAAVHFLLLSGSDHVLKHYYPSITESPLPMEDSFPHFKDFCRQQREEIISILQTKMVQTNEIRRCAYLYPSFCFIYNMVNKPLSLVEIGTSAGLQLLWDRYSYSYGTNEIFGDAESIVHLTAELRNGNTPFLLPDSPPVASKIGIDLHVNDLSNRQDYLWLKSLIWPEHEDRRSLFEQAASLLMANPIELLEGDGVSLLDDVVKQIPLDSVVCIFHTHVANQIPNDQKKHLLEKVKSIGAKRDVFHLYNNMWDAQLHLDYFINGTEYNEIIGMTEGHGRWFDWELTL